MQLTWETPLKNGGSIITGYIIERCEEGTNKWLRCNARLCPDLFYKVQDDGLSNTQMARFLSVTRCSNYKSVSQIVVNQFSVDWI